MRVLINASNLRKGGGVQVALSLIEEFSSYNSFSFHLVVSDPVFQQLKFNESNFNFLVSKYNLKPSVAKAIFGYDSFLSKVEREFKPDWVFTVFGPSYWIPKSKHLMGYAVPHYLYNDSPFFRIISFKERILVLILKLLCYVNLSRSNAFFWVETEDVKYRLANFLFTSSTKIRVVSNTCHSVFDKKVSFSNEKYDKYFANVSCKKVITISSNYSHKNLKIINRIVRVLKHKNIHLKFFLTLNDAEFKDYRFDKEYVSNLGPVDISDCPFLYSKVDFMFLPTLLECFSASYVEAMKMKVPILTSDLSFARGVCGNAAEYFDPLDEYDIVKKIFFLINNESRVSQLISEGEVKLKEFLSPKERALSIINIIAGKNIVI
jgi:glycosyltransferase involved in cell wall biosynthesis